MPLTPRQLEAVEIPDPPRDTCVTAGPGSGKTTVLIERYRRLVESGVPPSRVLAITFTEKAAYQMRRRLAEAFADRPELLRRIERAPVSTVDAFCARLLRENALAAGVDPAFQVLDIHEAGLIEKHAVEDALDAFLEEQPVALRSLLSSLAAPDLGTSLLEVYETMRAGGASFDALHSPPPPGVFGPLLAACEELGKVRLSDWSASQREQVQAALDWSGEIRTAGLQPASGHFRILAKFPANLNRAKRTGGAAEMLRDLKQILYPAAVQALTAAYFSRERDTLVQALERFDALFRARKRARGALDFADLEEHAVRLLRAYPAVREDVRHQFDHILMDEFQDTNGLQSSLLELLRRPGRFCAVGDINQAIYGFRHADPEIFRAYRDREAKAKAELRENWRSRAGILRAVSVLTGGRPGIEKHELIPAREFPSTPEPAVEVISCVGPDSAAALEMEAAWVARRIRELGESRPFDGIAVLLRSTTHLGVFTRAFDSEGIPYAVTGGRGFHDAQEVTDLIHLLRVAANPRDEISMAAVVRSPLAGVSDEALLRLRQQGNLAVALERQDPAADAVLDRFRDQLARWRKVHDPVAIVMEAMDSSGYELRLTARERRNVERLTGMLREMSRRATLSEIVDELAAVRDSDPREQDSDSADPGGCVRVQTIHSAKGLEFPVVFLPAMQAGTREITEPILYSPAIGLGMKWRNPATGESARDELFDRIQRALRDRDARESDRLLYVAMTRAEDRLILSCSSSGRLEHWAQLLRDQLRLDLLTPTGVPRVETGPGFPLRVLVTGTMPVAQPPLELPERESAAVIVDPPLLRDQYDSSATVTAVALFAQCPRRYWLSRAAAAHVVRSGGPEQDAAEYPTHDPLDASALGIQVHTLLAGGPVQNPHPEALMLAQRFHDSELGRRASRTLLAEREFAFEMAIEDVVVRGQIDLWFEEGGEVILVDYKTGDSEPAMHRAQISLYAAAIEMHTGHSVDRAFLYELRPDAAVEVRVEPVEPLMREFRQAQERSEFPLGEGSHCMRCPYYRGSCPAGAIQ